MHTLRNRILFFGPTVAAGAASMALYSYMMDNCFDAKGLLIPGNLPMKLLWVVGIGFLAYLLPLLTTIGGEGSHGDNFPRSLSGGLLMLLAGVVLLRSVDQLGLAQTAPVVGYVAPWVAYIHSMSDAALKVLPYLAALSMAALGVYRMAGKRPVFLLGGVVCLFYMLMLVTSYRLWSADPQLHDYAYRILAGVLLMLCSFHRTSCDAGVIQRKKLLFTCLAGFVCAAAACAGGFMPGFYLSGALWALGSVCVPAVLPPDPEEEEKEAEGSADAPEILDEQGDVGDHDR